MRFLLRALLLTGFLWLGGSGLADPVLPGSILDPQSAAEAWNVIRLVDRNVERLLEENRLAEIPVQISCASPALRALPQYTRAAGGMAELQAQLPRAFLSVNAIATGARQHNPEGARAALEQLRGWLSRSERLFEPAAVKGEVYCCPMHPEIRSEKAQATCPRCGMSLLARRLPYSFVYTRPGEPTVRMTVVSCPPLVSGQLAQVRLRLEKGDRTPLRPEDLLVMHTQPIHLLIEEAGLGDYHHEHPVPTETAGEYLVSFTPRKTVPYRVWADLVPVATGVQELPFVDLPSAGAAAAPVEKETRLVSDLAGYHFELFSSEAGHQRLRAGVARAMGLRVAAADGTPVTALEPVMNAFSHLVGFYEDYRTVLHLHPTGGEVTDDSQRGGPVLDFILFAPKAGFVRLYAQVKLGGHMLFVPFNLNVEP